MERSLKMNITSTSLTELGTKLKKAQGLVEELEALLNDISTHELKINLEHGKSGQPAHQANHES